MKRLSVVVITKNEEANLGRCLDSVKWADEIVVVDSHSTDRTLAIAAEYGAIVHSPDWRGYGPAKREGVKLAGGDWVLSIDADEAVSDKLAGQIREILNSDSGPVGYYVNRRTNFLGRWISHCGWYPDPILRLFRRDRGNFNEAVVHEEVILDGEPGRLDGELLHYSYPSLELYLEKSNVYTRLGAEEAFRRGKRVRWHDIVLRPPVAFVKHYITRQGFRDGMEGFIISVMSSVAVLMKYAKLRHMWKKERD